MRMRIVLPWIAIAAVCIGGGSSAYAQNPERLTVEFSTPSKPGLLRMHVMNGGITIRGENRKDVLIEARSRDQNARRTQSEPPAGLRRLTQAPGFNVEEENNEMVLSTGFQGRGMDFDIRVPTKTNLKLSSVNGGDIIVEGVDGEQEINNVNGPITLTNVAGSVVANSVNGKVLVTLTRVMPEKAMAFTSLNGTVDVTLPASTKATLKLRSDQGDVFTDFDVQMRPTTPAVRDDSRRTGGRFRIEVNKSIYGTVNGGGPEFELRTFNGSVYVRKGT